MFCSQCPPFPPCFPLWGAVSFLSSCLCFPFIELGIHLFWKSKRPPCPKGVPPGEAGVPLQVRRRGPGAGASLPCGIPAQSLFPPWTILTRPAGRRTFLETAGEELLRRVNEVSLAPGHGGLRAPPSLPCCPPWLLSPGRPACASTSCCHAAIFNLGCWLHP